ncbi:MAG: cobyrinate a,c-diamide synthase [Planctomycetota bacterium]
MVAGAGGDSGKTLVSLGLASAWRQAGFAVSAFKKGPDYIDAAWLSRAAERPARNLDTWLMGEPGVLHSFAVHSADTDVAVVEGNRGLLDGLDGTSTAALATTLGAPVLLVLDVTKVTRTAAAFVAGCRALAPEVHIAGVVANRRAGSRHESEVRRAIEGETGVPVLGAIPKLSDSHLLPDRHLGLVPPEEHDRMVDVVRRLGGVMAEHVDLDALLETARSAGPLESVPEPDGVDATGAGLRVAVFRDSAFTFYYPENLEALEAAGAEVVPVSALDDPLLPEVDLLYIGGGFPETHAAALAGNRSLIDSVEGAVRDGLPVYAECGGLIWLSRSVTWRGRTAEMAGVLGVDIEVMERPQGHGYAEMAVDEANPFFAPGTILRGHEFHYSRLTGAPVDTRTVMEVRRGKGSRDGRDGLVANNVFASWNHLHATATPEWAPALMAAARARRGRSGESQERATCGGRSR